MKSILRKKVLKRIVAIAICMSMILQNAPMFDFIEAFSAGEGETITVSISGSLLVNNKEYDGNNEGEIAPSSSYGLDGEIVDGDKVELDVSNVMVTFENSSVGEDKVVTISGLALTGEDASKYSLDNDTYTTTASITKKKLDIVWGVSDKTYDGTTDAVVDEIPFIDEEEIISGETVQLNCENMSASFTSSDAGVDKEVIVSGLVLSGTHAENYELNSETFTTTATINPKQLKVEGLSITEKPYDGTTDAEITGTPVLVEGDIIPGDDVQLSVGNLSAKFDGDDGANVGDNKDIVIEGLSLVGGQAGNYAIDTSAIKGKINKCDITIAAQEITIKKYLLDISKLKYSVSGKPENGANIDETGLVIKYKEGNNGAYSELTPEVLANLDIGDYYYKYFDMDNSNPNYNITYNKGELNIIEPVSADDEDEGYFYTVSKEEQDREWSQSITITPKDGFELEFSDNVEFEENDGTYNLKTQGENTVQIKIVDTETDKVIHTETETFKLDKGTPSIPIVSVKEKDSDEAYDGSATTKDIVFILSAPSNLPISGIEKYQYKKDGGEWQDMTQSSGESINNKYTLSENYRGDIYFRVISESGMEGEEKCVSVKRDNTTPKKPKIRSEYKDSEGNYKSYTGEKRTTEIKVFLSKNENETTNISKYQYRIGADGTWENIDADNNGEGQLIINSIFGNVIGNMYFRSVSDANVTGDLFTILNINYQPNELDAPMAIVSYKDNLQKMYEGEHTRESLEVKVIEPYGDIKEVQYSRTKGEDAEWITINKQDNEYKLILEKEFGSVYGYLYFRVLDSDDKASKIKDVIINYDITAPEITDSALDITGATVVPTDGKDKMYYGDVGGVNVNVTATDFNNIAKIYYYTSLDELGDNVKDDGLAWRLAYNKTDEGSSSMLDQESNTYSITLTKATACNGYIYIKVVDEAGNAAFSKIAKAGSKDETTNTIQAQYTNPYILYNNEAPNNVEVSATVVGTGDVYTSDQLIGKDVVIKVVSKDNVLTLIDKVLYKEDNKDYAEITQWKENSYENGYYEVEFTVSPEGNDASNYYFKMVSINGEEIVSDVFIVNIYKNIVNANIKVSGTTGSEVATGTSGDYVTYYSKWFKKDSVKVELFHNLKDEDKRLERLNTLFYTLDKADSNGKFPAESSNVKQYQDAITVTESGYYRVVAWNDDKLGNTSKNKVYAYFYYDAKSIKKDDVKVTFLNAEKEYESYSKYSVYAKENLKLKLSGKDDFSGVAEYEYCFNEKRDWKKVPYSAKNGYCIVLNSFSGKVNIRMIDKAGNVSDAFSTEPIMVGDGVPATPKISVTTEGGKTLKSGVWTDEKIVIVLTGSDSNYDIGINKYQYSTDGGNTWKTMKSTTNTVKRDEKVDDSDTYVKDKLSISADTYKTYSFRAVSNTGVVSKVATYNVRIDDTQPENSKVKYSKATGKTNPENGKWYTETAIINITAAKGKENEAPVTTYYKLWKEGETATTNKIDSNIELKITKDGVYNFEMWTKDEAGNNSSTTITKKIYVDKKAPSNILIGYTDDPSMNELETGKVEDYYSQPVKVTISATDFNSGVYGFRYTIRGEAGDNKDTGILEATKMNDVYVATMLINPEYLGGLTISAIDNAGNESEKLDDRVFVVSEELPTAPTLIVTSKDDILTSGQWTTQGIEISISDSKVIAGIAGYEYMIEGEDVWRKCETVVSKQNATDDKPSNINVVKLVLTEDQEETYLFRAISNSGIHGEISRFDIKKDSINPEINATHQDANLIGEKFYNETQKIEIVINELNFDPSKVEVNVSKDGALVNVGNITWTSAGNVHRGLVTLSASGDYTFEVLCADKADNTDEVKLDEFTIDLIAPELSISYDKDAKDNYCNSKRVATIKVIERNFDESNVKLNLTTSSEDIIVGQSEWSHNGDIHTKSIEFAKDGEYSIAVECTDMAMNEGVDIKRQEFIIDTVKPEVIISGVENTSANAKDIVIVVDAKDSYLADISYKLISNNKEVKVDVVKSENIEGGKRETLSAITEDGIYHFTYTVIDKAGNTTTDEYIFSVNKNGAAFEAVEDDGIDKNTGYAKEDYKPVIKIMDVDTITILSVTINGNEQTAGEDYEYDSATGTLKFLNAINDDGKYSVTVDVKDAAGNVSFMEPFEFIVDHTAPNLIVSGVEEGETYNEEVTVVLKPDNAEDKIVKVIVNGTELSEDKLVRSTTDNSVQITLSEFQSYTVSAIAEDSAGNTVTMEELNFKLMDSMVAGIPDYVLVIIILVIVAVITTGIVIIVKKKKNN